MNENNLEDLLLVEKDLKEKLLCVQGKIAEFRLKDFRLKTGISVGSIVTKKNNDIRYKVSRLRSSNKDSCIVHGYKQLKDGVRFGKVEQYIGYAGKYGDVEVVE